jgi:hypothetical protein
VHEPTATAHEPTATAHEPTAPAHESTAPAHEPTAHEPTAPAHEPTAPAHEPTAPAHEPTAEQRAADRALVEQTRSKEGGDLSPEQARAERRIGEAGERRPVEPPFTEGGDLPNGHKWRETAEGVFCRFSSVKCFDATGRMVETPKGAGPAEPHGRDPLAPKDFPAEVRDAVKRSTVHEATEWSAANARELPHGEYVYVVRDIDTGGIMKVGKTSHAPESNALDARMGLYRRAAELTGQRVQVELHQIDPGAHTTEHFEGVLRRQLYDQAPGEGAQKGFEWDNAAPHNRGRFGPGTPSESVKGDEVVTVKSVEGTKITVEHENGTVQTIESRKAAKARPGEPLEVPRDELYDWRSRTDKTGKTKWGIEYTGLSEPPKLSDPQRFKAMDPTARREWLEDILTKSNGNIEAVRLAFGIKKSQARAYLSPPWTDVPLRPTDFKGTGSSQ